MVSDEFDSYLRLYDPSGALIAENDDYDFPNSFISERLCEPGVYTIEADSYDAWGSGVYTLSLDSGVFSPEDCAPPTTTTTQAPTTTTAQPSVPTLAAPSLQAMTANSVSLTLPSKPFGFDYYGLLLVYCVFPYEQSPSDTWYNDCVVSNSWDYNGDQWGTTTTSASLLEAGTLYYVRWLIRTRSGEEKWSSPTAFVTT
jgi:hypothetical protein